MNFNTRVRCCFSAPCLQTAHRSQDLFHQLIPASTFHSLANSDPYLGQTPCMSPSLLISSLDLPASPFPEYCPSFTSDLSYMHTLPETPSSHCHISNPNSLNTSCPFSFVFHSLHSRYRRLSLPGLSTYSLFYVPPSLGIRTSSLPLQLESILAHPPSYKYKPTLQELLQQNTMEMDWSDSSQ